MTVTTDRRSVTRRRMSPAKLRRLIAGSGMTLEALSMLLQVSLSTVKSWSSGRRRPCCEHMDAFVESTINHATNKRKD